MPARAGDVREVKRTAVKSARASRSSRSRSSRHGAAVGVDRPAASHHEALAQPGGADLAGLAMRGLVSGRGRLGVEERAAAVLELGER